MSIACIKTGPEIESGVPACSQWPLVADSTKLSGNNDKTVLKYRCIWSHIRAAVSYFSPTSWRRVRTFCTSGKVFHLPRRVVWRPGINKSRATESKGAETAGMHIYVHMDSLGHDWWSWVAAHWKYPSSLPHIATTRVLLDVSSLQVSAARLQLPGSECMWTVIQRTHAYNWAHT